MGNKIEPKLEAVNHQKLLPSNVFTKTQYNKLLSNSEKKSFWDSFIQLIQESRISEAKKLLQQTGLTAPNHQALLDVISINHVEALKALLILHFHDAHDSFDNSYNRTELLERAMEAEKNSEILKALQETGRFHISHIYRMSQKPFNQISPLIEIFHWNVRNNQHLSKWDYSLTESTQLALHYENYLRRFIEIDPLRTQSLHSAEIIQAEKIREAYDLCLRPLKIYCETNLCDYDARKIYQDSYKKTANTPLNTAHLEKQLATLLKSDTSSAKTLTAPALVALVTCYANATGAQKKPEPLSIADNYFLKIQTEIQKLQSKEVTARFKLRCLQTVYALLATALLVGILGLILFANPMFIIPMQISIALMAVLSNLFTTTKCDKTALDTQLTLLTSIEAVAEIGNADKPAPTPSSLSNNGAASPGTALNEKASKALAGLSFLNAKSALHDSATQDRNFGLFG